MKTWQCGRCGTRYQLSDDRDGELMCGCGEPLAKPNGIVIGNGVYSIWDDGVVKWTGSAMDAVEFIAAMEQASAKLGELPSDIDEWRDNDKHIACNFIGAYLIKWAERGGELK